MNRTTRCIAIRGALLLASSVLVPGVLRAQVGHPPSGSPYQDLTLGQNLSLSGGWLSVTRDPAGVAPKSSPFVALRYDIPVGGPAALYGRYTFASTERSLIVPANSSPTRVIATPGVTMHALDLGLDIALTGKKTWRRLAPSVMGGAGIVSDFTAADTGAYRFGTKFAFSYGGAVRFVPRDNGIAFRVDVTNYIWQYQYPDRYFVRAPDNTSVLTDTRQRSAYRGNWALSVGATLPLFR